LTFLSEKGAAQLSNEPGSFVSRRVVVAGRRGSQDSHQFCSARLSCYLMRFGVPFRAAGHCQTLGAHDLYRDNAQRSVFASRKFPGPHVWFQFLAQLGGPIVVTILVTKWLLNRAERELDTRLETRQTANLEETLLRANFVRHVTRSNPTYFQRFAAFFQESWILRGPSNVFVKLATQSRRLRLNRYGSGPALVQRTHFLCRTNTTRSPVAACLSLEEVLRVGQ
jgi:hypothetical protein